MKTKNTNEFFETVAEEGIFTYVRKVATNTNGTRSISLPPVFNTGKYVQVKYNPKTKICMVKNL